jgi:hypothetical protein
MTARFDAAPWPKTLKVTSTIATLLLGVVGYAAARAIPPVEPAHTVGTLVALVPPLIAVFCALLVVKGYEVDATRLRVRRLLWDTVIRLDDLAQVWHDPEATKGSLRVFGNGGLYSFTGVFQNRKLGRYRAFITDSKCAVVLQLRRRVLVVTPALPEAFVAHVRTFCPNVAVGPPPVG